MKARTVLIGSGVIAAIVLLPSPAWAQVVPQPLSTVAASTVDTPPALATATQLTTTLLVQFDRNSDMTAPMGGGGGISPYHTTRQRLSENTINDHAPVVAYNPKRDEYLVVWSECPTNEVCNVVGRRTTGQGVPISPTFAIATDTTIGYRRLATTVITENIWSRMPDTTPPPPPAIYTGISSSATARCRVPNSPLTPVPASKRCRAWRSTPPPSTTAIPVNTWSSINQAIPSSPNMWAPTATSMPAPIPWACFLISPHRMWPTIPRATNTWSRLRKSSATRRPSTTAIIYARRIDAAGDPLGSQTLHRRRHARCHFAAHRRRRRYVLDRLYLWAEQPERRGHDLRIMAHRRRQPHQQLPRP